MLHAEAQQRCAGSWPWDCIEWTEHPDQPAGRAALPDGSHPGTIFCDALWRRTSCWTLCDTTFLLEPLWCSSPGWISLMQLSWYKWCMLSDSTLQVEPSLMQLWLGSVIQALVVGPFLIQALVVGPFLILALVVGPTLTVVSAHSWTLWYKPSCLVPIWYKHCSVWFYWAVATAAVKKLKPQRKRCIAVAGFVFSVQNRWFFSAVAYGSHHR